MDTLRCHICEKEMKGNFRDDVDLLCWRCIHQLSNTPLDKIRELIAVYRERGQKSKSDLLQSFPDWNKTTQKRAEIERGCVSTS